MYNEESTSRMKAHALRLINSKRYSEALQFLDEMCRSHPEDSGLWLLCGIAQGGLGAYQQAAEMLCKTIELTPGRPEAHYYLGQSLQALGKKQDAINAYREAIELKPDYWEVYYGLARALHQSGDLNPAIAAYQKAIAINPLNGELHANLGIAYKSVGKNDLAVESLKESLRQQPDRAEVYFNLGNLHQGQRELQEAQACYRKAVQLKPGWIKAEMALSRVLMLQGEEGKALDICEQILRQDPGNQEVIVTEASIMEQIGDPGGAYRKLQPLIEAGSYTVGTLITYAKLVFYSGNHSDVINLLERSVESSDHDIDDLRQLHFTLADTYDSVAEYDRAFTHYQKGNALKPGKYNQNEWSYTVEKTIRTFTTEFLDCVGGATTLSRLPVFIVGMPRTGSTLLEQALSRHTGIHGAGELPDIKNIAGSLPGVLATNLRYPECLARLSTPIIDQVADNHLKRLSRLSEGALRVIDKMPGNFLHLGLIQILFPDATIFHTVRNPLDTCLSCFMRDIGGGASYSADLKSLAMFYREYRRLMDHWKEVLQIEMVDVIYEEFIEDFESRIKSLITLCGMEWQEQCKRHLGNRRVVATPSYAQVRKPLYKNSIAKWKHYESHLGPLIDALEDFI